MSITSQKYLTPSNVLDFGRSSQYGSRSSLPLQPTMTGSTRPTVSSVAIAPTPASTGPILILGPNFSCTSLGSPSYISRGTMS
jgi:hypothetical protein